MSNLSGKTALVTGASRGIGRASALALAKAGAQVLVHYGSGEKAAAAVVAEIRQAGGRAEKVAADLRAPDGPHALAARVRTTVGDRLQTLSIHFLAHRCSFEALARLQRPVDRRASEQARGVQHRQRTIVRPHEQRDLRATENHAIAAACPHAVDDFVVTKA